MWQRLVHPEGGDTREEGGEVRQVWGPRTPQIKLQ